MDFAKSFSYITEDQDWVKKIGIAAVLMLTGIGSFAVYGWGSEIIKRVAANREQPLPDWTDIGEYFIRGLKIALIGFVWTLPLFVISLCLFTPGLLSGSLDDETIAMLSAFSALCFVLIAILYSLVLAEFTAPLYGLVAEDRSIGELLKPTTAWQYLRANPGNYSIALFLGLVITGILASVGILLCGIGTFIGSAFGIAVMMHLLGQAHGQAGQSLATAPHQVSSQTAI